MALNQYTTVTLEVFETHSSLAVFILTKDATQLTRH
jgi:hypothetical protein